MKLKRQKEKMKKTAEHSSLKKSMLLFADDCKWVCSTVLRDNEETYKRRRRRIRKKRGEINPSCCIWLSVGQCNSMWGLSFKLVIQYLGGNWNEKKGLSFFFDDLVIGPTEWTFIAVRYRFEWKYSRGSPSVLSMLGGCAVVRKLWRKKYTAEPIECGLPDDYTIIINNSNNNKNTKNCRSGNKTINYKLHINLYQYGNQIANKQLQQQQQQKWQ